MLIEETFNKPVLDPKLQWYCEPASWKIENGKLLVATDADTDFWQKTHYGFQVDNGHFLYTETDLDFVLETEVDYDFVNQYDQAGLMVRNSKESWVKTAIEFEPDESNKLGAVVTNHGYSDWSTQDVSKSLTRLKLKIIRKGSDYIIQFFHEGQNEWSQMRMFHLAGDAMVKAGLYCCSPKKSGFIASFSYLTIK